MNNMYKLSVAQFNPFVGCAYNCVYCKSSFQRQLKRWAKNHCEKCYTYQPHEHPERLNQKLPKTGYMQFIFVCACGDVAFARPEYLQQIADKMAQWPDRTFLLQSKNPRCFQPIKFSANVILGTTIETTGNWIDERTHYEKISKAPKFLERLLGLDELKHDLKMITFEPILDFNVSAMIYNTLLVKPTVVWIGYDSGNNHLPEPPIEKVRELIWELQKAGIVVVTKRMKDENSKF